MFEALCQSAPDPYRALKPITAAAGPTLGILSRTTSSKASAQEFMRHKTHETRRLKPTLHKLQQHLTFHDPEFRRDCVAVALGALQRPPVSTEDMKSRLSSGGNQEKPDIGSENIRCHIEPVHAGMRALKKAGFSP